MASTPQSNPNHAISGNGPSPSSNNSMSSLGGNSTHLPPQHQQQLPQQPIQAGQSSGALNSSSASQTTSKSISFLPVNSNHFCLRNSFLWIGSLVFFRTIVMSWPHLLPPLPSRQRPHSNNSLHSCRPRLPSPPLPPTRPHNRQLHPLGHTPNHLGVIPSLGKPPPRPCHPLTSHPEHPLSLLRPHTHSSSSPMCPGFQVKSKMH